MPTSTIKRFRGLNTVTDPLRLDARSQTLADNVKITDTGGVKSREGFTLALGGQMLSAHVTKGGTRMYVQDGDKILAVRPDMSTTEVVSGVAAVPVLWGDLNDEVMFYDRGGKAGLIDGGHNVIPWRWPVPPQPSVVVGQGNLPAGTYRVAYAYLLPDGRETGMGETFDMVLQDGSSIGLVDVPQEAECKTLVYIASADSTVLRFAGVAGASFSWDSGPDSLGAESAAQFSMPVPYDVTHLAVYGAKVFAAMPMPAHNQTVVWISMPMAPHLWSVDRDFFLVPGEVRVLHAAADGVLVGTDRGIHHYDPNSGRIRQLADWGVLPGHACASTGEDAKRVTYIWTERGVCAYPDFRNLTEESVSVAPGTSAAAAVVHDEGQSHFVVALRSGGDAFNP